MAGARRRGASGFVMPSTVRSEYSLRQPGRDSCVLMTMGDLTWDGCVNVRDLGGLGRLRPGAVVRMEAPHRLTEDGWAAAWAHGVRTFVDLRDEAEGDPDEATGPAGVTTGR